MCDCNQLLTTNKAKVLELFLFKNGKVLFAIGLYRILKLLNDVECYFAIPVDINSTMISSCWICCEKQRLFREAYEEHRKRHRINQETCDDSVDNPNEISWNRIENWFLEESENDKSKLPDFFDEIKTSPSEATLFWENLFSQILKNLKDFDEDPVATESLKRNPGHTHLCSVLASTTLNLHQLTTRFPSHYFSDFSNDFSSTVSIKICQKCLKQISFDADQKVQQSSCFVLRILINHILSLDNMETNRKRTGSQADENNSLPPKLTADNSNPQSKRIKITLVRCNKKANLENQLKPVLIGSKPSISVLPVRASRPLQVVGGYSTNYGYPTTGAISMKRLSGESALVASNPVAVGTKVESLNNSRLVKFNVTGLKSNIIFSKFSKSISNLKSSTVTSAKPSFHMDKRNILKRSSLKVGSHFQPLIPQANRIKFPPNKSDSNAYIQSNSVQKYCIFRPFSEIKLPKRNSFSFSIQPKQTTQPFVPFQTQDVPKSSPLANFVKQRHRSKRTCPAVDGKRDESSRKKTKKVDSKSPSLTSNSSLREETKQPPDLSIRQLKPLRNDVKAPAVSSEKSKDPNGKQRNLTKTPVKRKKPDKVPMNAIVRSFLSRSKQQLDQAEQMKRNRPKRCRSKRSRSAKKLIPIPYEAHYLCIHETLAKKGWKAYWYQKCRCARVEKKKPKLLRRSPRKHCTDLPKTNSSNLKEFSFNTTPNPPKVSKSVTDKAATVQFESTPRNSNNNSSCEMPKSLVEVRNSTERSSRPDVKGLGVVIADRNISGEESTTAIDICSDVFEMQSLTVDLIQKALVQLDTSFTAPLAQGSTLVLPEENISNENEFSLVEAQGDIRIDEQQTFSTETKRPTLAESAPSCPPSSESLYDRRLMVDGVAQLVMKRLGNASLQRDVVSDERFSRLHLFSQRYDEIDEQPGSMDIIGVDPVLLKSYPEFFSRAKNVERERKAIQEEYLKESQNQNHQTFNASRQNDLESIWNFGRPVSFFSEKQGFNAKLKQTKAQFVKKPIKKIDKAISSRIGFRCPTKKKPIDNGTSSKVYRHHSRRPKLNMAPRRPAAKKPEENKSEFEPGIGPYIIPWDIPKTSVSSVVGVLEHVWDELDDESGFIGLTDRTSCPDNTILSYESVSHALSALKDCSKIFTFSSQPKNGKNTVLLIKRKLIDDRTSPEQKLKIENGYSFLDENESSRVSESAKILLKLRKAGEVSGSVIYKVPSSPASRSNSLASDPASSSTNTSSKCDSCSETNVVANQSGIAEKTKPSRTSDFVVEDPPMSPQNNVLLTTPRNLSNSSLTDIKKHTAKTQNLLTCTQLKETSLDDSAGFNENLLKPNFAKETFLIDDFMHSTMINEDDGIDESYFEEQSSLPKHVTDSFDINDRFLEEEVEVLDWDGRIKGGDCLEELLLSLNENTFEDLEQIFFHEKTFNLSPLTLTHLLNSHCSDSKSGQNIRLFTNELDTSPEKSSEKYFTRKNSFVKEPDLCSRMTPMQSNFFSRFSTHDSPEVARGNSCLKSREEEFFPALLSAPDESDMSNSIPTNTPNLSASEDPSTRRNHSSPNPLLRSCNVLLEPLEEVLQDIQKKKESGDEERGSFLKPGSTIKSKMPLSESSVRELNRLLKNRALNGAYWNSPTIDANSSGSSSGRWRFRDRNKVKKLESRAVESEVDSDEEEEEVDIEKEEPSVHYPKRKNRGRENPFRPTDSNLRFFLKKFSKDQIQSTKRSLSGENTSTTSTPAPSDMFRSIFSRNIDFSEVRRWILEASLSHPRPFCSSLLLHRKPTSVRKRRPSVNEEATDTSSVEAETFSESSPKKTKKESSRASGKTFLTEEFQALRRRLFRLRHPDYTGSLTSDAEAHPPSSRMSRSYVKLYCVDAEKAKSDDSPTFSSDFILGNRPNCEDSTLEAQKKQRRVLPSSSCDSQSSASSLGDVFPEISPHRRPVIQLKDHALPSRHSRKPTSPTKSASAENLLRPVSVSSRGRTIRPSFRNRPIVYESPIKKKRRSSCPASAPPKKRATIETSPTTLTCPRRFSSKHATAGAYIKKVLESGAYT